MHALVHFPTQKGSDLRQNHKHPPTNWSPAVVHLQTPLKSAIHNTRTHARRLCNNQSFVTSWPFVTILSALRVIVCNEKSSLPWHWEYFLPVTKILTVFITIVTLMLCNKSVDELFHYYLEFCFATLALLEVTDKLASPAVSFWDTLGGSSPWDEVVLVSFSCVE